MADAWVRVVPSDTVSVGGQADRLVAGAAVLVGRYSNGKVWAISAKNSATGTEMFGGKVDEGANTLRDPQWGTQYSLTTGDVQGKWCPSPPDHRWHHWLHLPPAGCVGSPGARAGRLHRGAR